MVGRPTNSEETISRTYRLFRSDVEIAVTKDWDAKLVYRAGVQTLLKNPGYIGRIQELETNIAKLQEVLTRFGTKINDSKEKIDVLIRENAKLRQQMKDFLGLESKDNQEVNSDGRA